MKEHPANEFRNLRSKYFAIAHKHDFKMAFYILEKDKDTFMLSDEWYTGLLCELIFFRSHINDFDLIPTLDCGDHVDFQGILNNHSARFDVTSSLLYKDLETYSEFQQKGKPYYIALIDPKLRKVDRIIDINFPFCQECGGRLINVALIGNIEYTNAGIPTQSERVIKVCSNDYSHMQEIGEFEYFIPSIGDEKEYLYNYYEDDEEGLDNAIKNVPLKHGIDNSLFFSKLIGDKIHACGQNKYTLTDRDGDGYWETELYWMSDMVDTIFPNELGVTLE